MRWSTVWQEIYGDSSCDDNMFKSFFFSYKENNKVKSEDERNNKNSNIVSQIGDVSNKANFAFHYHYEHILIG